ncbi:PAS domain S-box protein [Candidatus Halobonum tyrrellensis]|uniref:histidine kinase n=1 Tax=Candidatus Halobonum tyrrellensis G22 TaxID=1324957 RepID=V4HB07_9EURY|nr:PAS domain S-box protein [Candidatus Halobonum tyrrellensis]ESP87870.1 pas domain s-box [Candidatus Halobonum tyrrellensis G22]
MFGVSLTVVLAAASFLTAAAMLGVVPLFYRATRGSAAGVRVFVVGTAVAASLSAVAYGFHLTAVTLAAQAMWARVALTLGAPLVTCWFALAVRYTGRERRLGRAGIGLLAVEPSFAAVGSATGWFDYLSGTRLTIVDGQPLAVLDAGPGLVAHGVYTALLGAATVAVLWPDLREGSTATRRRAALLLVAGTAPAVGWALWGLELSGLLAVDHTPLALLVSTGCLYVATRWYGLFTTLPVARETVFEGMRDGVVVADDRGRVVETNAAARRLLGVDESAVGSDLAAVLPAAFVDDGSGTDESDPDETGGATRARGRRATSPSTSDGDAAGGPAGVDADRPPGGERVVRTTVGGEQRYLEHRRTPLPAPTEGTVLTVRDVTERVRAQRRYRAYVEHARDVIIVTNGAGELQYVSPAIESLLGYDADALYGDSLEEYVHPDDRESVFETFADARARPDEVVRVSFRARHADGGWRALEGSGVNRLHDRDVGGFLVTLRDVTAEERYEQRLRVLTRVLRHDLRNELNVVLGYADALAADGDDRTAEWGATIRDSAERLAALGERVRGVDRSLRGTDHGGRPTDVARVVDRVAERLAERHPEADVAVDCDGVAAAYADDLLPTAVWNLAENAVEHHDGDPTVRFGVRCDGETVVVRVCDDGPGIPESERRPVESGHETQLEHASGLGLWLTRWIVDGVDGDIAFHERDSEVGCACPSDRSTRECDPTGSVVTLHLRAAEADDLPASPAPLDVRGTSAGGPEVGRADGGGRDPERYPGPAEPPESEPESEAESESESGADPAVPEDG